MGTIAKGNVNGAPLRYARKSIAAQWIEQVSRCSHKALPHGVLVVRFSVRQLRLERVEERAGGQEGRRVEKGDLLKGSIRDCCQLTVSQVP